MIDLQAYLLSLVIELTVLPTTLRQNDNAVKELLGKMCI